MKDKGNFSPQSAGTHPESNTLGTGSGTFQANFWVEIQGKITTYSPTVSTSVGQTAVSYGTNFDSANNVVVPFNNYPVHDDDPFKSRQYNDGKGNIGFVDAPGWGGAPAFLALHQEFTSYIKIDGKIACSIDWTIDTYIFHGVVTQVFNGGSSN